MLYYFAPMEGLTDSVYRRLHHQYFGGVDRYYMPFISPTIHRTLTKKEDRELPMADSEPFTAIPQILTRDADAFLWAAEQCAQRGYKEVNLNIGCPSGTVTAKGKGAGMLADPDGLDRFLDQICAASALPVSVKTRVGVTDESEFPRLVEIFNQYPIRELIIHPRTRKDFYNAPLRPGAFAYAAENCKLPLCYNGDLCAREDIRVIQAAYPGLNTVMLGRGLIGDPGMLSGKRDAMQAFHDHLLEEYTALFGSARNAMFRLKENWFYLAPNFENSEKLAKKLRKTTDMQEYRSITAEIFQTLPFRPICAKCK